MCCQSRQIKKRKKMKTLTDEQIKKSFKSVSRKWSNNRQRDIMSVFYKGDNVAILSGNALDNNIHVIRCEVENSDWNKAFGVHSPNGMICVKINGTNETFLTWVPQNQILFLN